MAKTGEEKLKKVLNDFSLFSRNMIKITDNSNNKIKFVLNEAQEDIWKLLKTERFLVLPKSRQAGISTEIVGFCLWKALTVPGSNCLIVSYKQQSAHSLFEKLKEMEADLPRDKFPELFPKVKRSNRSEMVFMNGSVVKSTTSGHKSIGRGETFDVVLFSELAFYPNIESQLLSVEQAMSKNPDSRIVIESTANGMNHFHTLCTAALQNRSKYKLYFIPFYHKLYKKQFAHDYDLAESWYKASMKGERLSKKDLSPDELLLFEAGASLKQLMWRQWKRQDMTEQEFFQEFPANIYQAFISSGQNVFDQQKVLQRLGNIIEPLTRDELEGEIPSSLIEYIGKGLEVYYLPEHGKRYWGGVDSASGSGGNADSSTLFLIDADGQNVLSFNSNKVPVYLFAELLNEMGRWFNYVYLCIERNGLGLPIIERLRNDHEYMNLFKQKVFDEKGRKRLQLGFITSTKTKSISVSDFKEQFEKGLINIECKTTLLQMQQFVENSNGSMGNKKGNGEKNHDDSVDAACLAVQAMKENKWYVD